MHAHALLSMLSAATALVAQQATVQVFGSPCATAEGRPSLSASGVPQLGSSFTLVYDGPNHLVDNAQTMTRPTLLIGFSIAGPVVLPRELFPAQPRNCVLFPAADWIAPVPFPDPLAQPYATRFPDAFTIAIPNDVALIGLPFYAQWTAFHTQCGFAGCDPWPLWIGASEAAICTIGL